MGSAPGRPRRIRVGHLTYRVVVDPAEIRAVSDANTVDDGDETWEAFSDHERLIIGINRDAPLDVQRRDLVHEVLHCVLRHSGVWPNAYAKVLSRSDVDTGYDVEEYVVGAQSAPLLGVLRDNPSLVRWLLA